MARQKYVNDIDEDEEFYSDKKNKERDNSRKKQRKIKNALRSKDLRYLSELEDEGLGDQF